MFENIHDATGNHPLEQTSPQIKTAYIKILINLAFEDDNLIDEKELNELQIILSQLHFDNLIREDITKYVAKPSVATITLLAVINQAETEAIKTELHTALANDLSMFYKTTKKTASIKDSTFIIKILQGLSFTDEQINTLDEETSRTILNESKNDDKWSFGNFISKVAVTVNQSVTRGIKVGTEIATTAKEISDETGLTDRVNEHIETAYKKAGEIKDKSDELGITDKLNTGAEYAKQTTEVFTGEKQLALIEERLALQMRYNDILATKLDEALTRIKTLEDKLDDTAG